MTRGRTAGGFIPLRGDLEWRDHAVCANQDPELFAADPPPPSASGVVKAAHFDRVVTALRVCGTCPQWVRAACLKDAYDTGDRWTVRGGTTGDQRVQSRRVQATRELRQARALLAEAGAR